MKIIILILTFLLSNQLIAKQKIYKWTDAHGNVHYSENKPHNTEVKEVKVATGKSKPKNTFMNRQESESEANESNETKSASEKAFDEYNQREKQRAEKQQNKESCKIAKKNLITLQNSFRVRRKDPTTGEYSYMSGNQHSNAIKSAKKLIQEVCK